MRNARDPQAVETFGLMRHWERLAVVVFRHFNLDEEQRRMAVIAARRSPVAAVICYSMIANSLRRDNK